MTTPSASRPHSGSTPKNSSIATPTAMLQSPRPPTSAAMARKLSQKSPAMKTPASGYGHTHNVSTSSHPSSTPLAAPAFGEDSLNFNSPAAMMMSSLGSHGLTPLPSGGDGLGISTDLHAVSTGQGSVLGTRNLEEDRTRRLQEVIKLLRTSIAGRGIYREGVERLAQLAGFTHMWQGDTLAIAGTCVDLEISFDGTEKDKAKDVVLKIFTAESGEHKKDASDVLKSNLEQAPDSRNQLPWRSLEGFASNLEHLGKMDHLSQAINCFEAIDGLYLTFKKIWDGEKQRMGQCRYLDRLSQGKIGRPVLNRKGKLGLSVEYWAERRHSAATKSNQIGDDAMQIDQPETARDANDKAAGVWAAGIDCEAGYPSLRVSKEWIVESSLNAKPGGLAADEPLIPDISWTEPPPTLIRPADSVNALSDIKIPKPQQVRFVFNLGPTVLVPLSVASSILNRPGLSVTLDVSEYLTYEQALRSAATNLTQTKDDGTFLPFQRWSKSLCTFDANGKALSHHHSYSLYSTPAIWWYPVSTVAFDHPKHLADLVPTFRQYILVWTLLRSIMSTLSFSRKHANSPLMNPAVDSEAQGTKYVPRTGVVKRSNVDARRAKIDMLLRAAHSEDIPLENTSVGSVTPGSSQELLPLPVDVSLSLTSSTPPGPKLDLIWPLQTRKGLSTSSSEATFGSVTIEIGPDGGILVPSASGIPWAESEKGRKAIARVIELSEDLSILIEWIMEKLSM